MARLNEQIVQGKKKKALLWIIGNESSSSLSDADDALVW